MNNIPVIDINDKAFNDKLNFELKSTNSCSDYRNDRERPYNGQMHTDEGKRGQAMIYGLTMRDIKDCMVQGFLSASTNPDISSKTKEIDKEFKNTKYARKNNWRVRDVYEIGDVDPIAVIQNATCFIEDMMGIFPNLPDNCPTAEDIIKNINNSNNAK